MKDELYEMIIRGLRDAERVVQLNKESAKVERVEVVGMNVLAVELSCTREGWTRFVDRLIKDKFSVRTQGWRDLTETISIVQLYVSIGKPRVGPGGVSPYQEGREFFNSTKEDNS